VNTGVNEVTDLRKPVVMRSVGLLLSLLLICSAVGEERRGPLLSWYRQRTLQFEHDAKEAEAAAKQYARMAEAVAQSPSNNIARQVARQLDLNGAKQWASSNARVDHMLHDPRAQQAQDAAEAAAAPYRHSYDQYVHSQQEYSAAAQGFAQRAIQEATTAHQLNAYASQSRLEGNEEKAGTYASQADQFMREAVQHKKQATEYDEVSRRIHLALPKIDKMAIQAGEFAAWEQNPSGALHPGAVYDFLFQGEHPPGAGVLGAAPVPDSLL